MISFAITTHNEGIYVEELLDQLIPHCESTGDELVVLDDYSDDPFTADLLVSTLARAGAKGSKLQVRLAYRKLNGDFAAHKNHLNRMCTGDYIFQIDADETLHTNLLELSGKLIDLNPSIDLFLIPRVNIVHGLTDEDINQWGWKVNHKGYVMWPDYQTRLYRNHPDIQWHGKVHERIAGYTTTATLPAEEEWAIYHTKEIERQRQQNELYRTIGR